jgi:hypothetical protein
VQVGTHRNAAGPDAPVETLDQLRRRRKPLAEREVRGVGVEACEDGGGLTVMHVAATVYLVVRRDTFHICALPLFTETFCS